MSKLLKVSALSLFAASLATCEARGNLRRLENLDFRPPKSVPESYDATLAKDEALVELLADLIGADSDESSSEDEPVGNYDEIPVFESSGDSEDDGPPAPDDDLYAEIPVYGDEAEVESRTVDSEEVVAALGKVPSDPHADVPVFDIEAVGPDTSVKGDSAATNYFIGHDMGGVELGAADTEVKSWNVDAEEVIAVLGKVPSDPHLDVPVFDIETVGPDTNIKGDSVATNYFIGHDMGGVELGMEGFEGEEDMEDSPEEDSVEDGYAEDPFESHDELPVSDPEAEE